jgi:two-component system chemotaxis response regulator CheB
MFSSLTYDGARATLDALDAGAVDFLPKRFSDISGNTEEAKRLLCERVRLVGRRRAPRGAPPAPAPRPAPARRPEPAPGRREATDTAPPARPARTEVGAGRVRLVVIGTSTGGPVALQRVLTQVPARFPLPILLVQHMPGSFTTAFAARLNQICAIEVREAADGDTLRPGVALLAPGGRQMGLQRAGGQIAVRVFDADDSQFYKPSVDITFTEAARFCPGKVLGVVLTGMGADGCQGARELKRGGSMIWAQDEASSVIYGMPGAVAKAGLTDQVLGLDDIGTAIGRLRS